MKIFFSLSDNSLRSELHSKDDYIFLKERQYSSSQIICRSLLKNFAPATKKIIKISNYPCTMSEVEETFVRNFFSLTYLGDCAFHMNAITDGAVNYLVLPSFIRNFQLSSYIVHIYMLEYVLILLPFMKNFQDSQQMFIWCSEKFEPFLCKAFLPSTIEVWLRFLAIFQKM